MNRPFLSVILGGFGAESGTAAAGDGTQKTHRSGSSEDAAFMLRARMDAWDLDLLADPRLLRPLQEVVVAVFEKHALLEALGIVDAERLAAFSALMRVSAAAVLASATPTG
jgi:hypothetical protein